MARGSKSMAAKAAVAASVAILGAIVVLCFISNASWKRTELLQRNLNGARTEELWFGAGVTDQMNRMVNIGKSMSPHMREILRRGMRAQSRMVHLDQFHQSEVQQAAGESDIWDSLGGNNNGGNEPCMAAEGECP